MLKKIIALALVAIFISASGCSRDKDISKINKNPIQDKTRMISNNDANQETILKKYEKYLPKIQKVLEDYGIEAKNLNENANDIDFVSRLVFESEEMKLNSNVKTFWFGIVYDENNIAENLNLYLEYNLDEEYNNEGIANCSELIADIGKVFFKFTSFSRDVNSTIETLYKSKSSEHIILEYKKGFVEIMYKQDSIVFNISIK